jgi:outer membrane protein assembly factor BamB
MGPDYRESDALRRLGQIIGQHNPHIIPQGLSGAGNLLVFDNGGASGYGFPNPAAPDGRDSVRRGNSRVVEVNPVTFEKVWEYSVAGAESYRFFSHYVSGAQRLVNGNTMITEGADGRIFEVTPMGEIVWEYVSPYFTQNGGTNRVYRAYRLPYDWVPQLERPAERAVIPPNVRDFRIPPQ